jgi:hypothetical protein
MISRVATDSQDGVYVFQRKDPPLVVFDREGQYLGAWGSGAVTDPHGLKIDDDVVYTTDSADSVASRSRWTANPCWSSAKAACIPTPAATGPPGSRRARRGLSITRPR